VDFGVLEIWWHFILRWVWSSEIIVVASIEQRSGADQVNNAIQQLNQVTQQNAASSEELSTSSEELSSQADQLQEVILNIHIIIKYC